MAQKRSNPPPPAGARPAPPPNPPIPSFLARPRDPFEDALDDAERDELLHALGVVLSEARTLYALCGEHAGAAEAMARAEDAARWYV